jgi:hypothetical protein
MKKAPDTFDRAGAGEQLSLLPPLTFCPQWPSTRTLAYTALMMMLTGETIEHRQFDARTGSWRLAAVIFRVKALGWKIDKIEVPSPTAERPGRVIAKYKLDAKQLAEALAVRGGA